MPPPENLSDISDIDSDEDLVDAEDAVENNKGNAEDQNEDGADVKDKTIEFADKKNMDDIKTSANGEAAADTHPLSVKGEANEMDEVAKKEERNNEEETESGSAKTDDAITLSINKEEEFEEEKESRKDLDALSDLSLSEDEKKDEWLVLDDINDDANGGKTENAAEKEKTTTASVSTKADSCTKCDVPHKPGDRCSFLLKSSSNKQRPAQPPARQQARVRTLPPELYNNPDRAAPGHRSRRSDSPPHRVAPPRRRIAPPPPSPPGYEDRRDKRARYDNYESDRYEPSRSEQELARSRYQVMSILIIFWSINNLAAGTVRHGGLGWRLSRGLPRRRVRVPRPGGGARLLHGHGAGVAAARAAASSCARLPGARSR